MKVIGILVVSFGTSFDETREKNIGSIERAVGELEHKVYRAFTSNIIRKVLKRRGIQVDDVSEAMEKMKADGVTDVYVLPTHLLYGYEYEKMMEMIAQYEGAFASLRIAKPLLSDTHEMIKVVNILADEIKAEKGEAVVLMGHGTEHFSNAVYPAMNYVAREQGISHMFVGTVEGYPLVDAVVSQVKEAGYEKVLLTPLMLVAGDHAMNDMASEEEDSWKSIFEAYGIEVRVLIKGLGEYRGIRQMYMEHLQEMM